MADLPRIRIPWAQRWRRVRYQFLPVVMFAASAVAAGLLWRERAGMTFVVGEVAAVQADVTSRAEGLLVAPEQLCELLQDVKEGTVIARLDAKPTHLLLATLQAELDHLSTEVYALEAELRQEHEDRQADRMYNSWRMVLQAERLRLDAVEQGRQRELARVQLRDAEAQAGATKELVARGMAPKLELSTLEAQRDTALRDIAEAERALVEIERQQKEVATALQGYPAAELHDLEKRLAPTRAAVATQQARIKEVEQQISNLDIRAPFSGTVVAIYRRPGQTVRVGEPILALAAKSSTSILAYVRQDSPVRPDPGMPVEVRLRSLPVQRVDLKVSRVGPQVLPVPLHQLRDPKIQEWGVPVGIDLQGMPAEVRLRPGELVDIALKPAH